MTTIEKETKRISDRLKEFDETMYVNSKLVTTASECIACGAIVESKDSHSAWHTLIEELTRKSTWGL